MTLSDNARDFWLAAAAAAPIIALAGLVAITDSTVTGNIVKRARADHPELKKQVAQGTEKIGPPTPWIIAYNILNLVAQGFVLIVALLALLQGGTPIPGILIVAVEGVGLLFLLLAALLAGQVGAERQRWEDQALRRETAEQLADAIAIKLGQLPRA